MAGSVHPGLAGYLSSDLYSKSRCRLWYAGGENLVFVGITLLVLLAMLIGYRWIAKAGRLYQWALGLIAGGAIGNLVDRMSYTRVIDFLDFRVWPVFNLADTFICIGVGLILLDALKEFKKG